MNNIYDEFIDKLVDYMDKVIIGDPMNINTGLGPIAREVKNAGYSKIASLAPEVL